MSKQLRIWLFVLLSTLLTSTSLLAEGVITMTTSRAVGELIALGIKANGYVSIEGAKESMRAGDQVVAYILTSQTVTIRGSVTELYCGDVSYYGPNGDTLIYHNKLTSLDVSGCTSLMELVCSNNQLTNLDLSGCTALTELDCSSNQLSSLDASTCISLTKISCYKNHLKGEAVTQMISSLPNRNQKETGSVYIISDEQNGEENNPPRPDILIASKKNWSVFKYKVDSKEGVFYSGAGNDKIVITTTHKQYLEGRIRLAIVADGDVTIDGIYEKRISTDGSVNTYTLAGTEVTIRGGIAELDCSGNQLTNIDLSNCGSLWSLRCAYNQLTSLDASEKMLLTKLDCSDNQLSSLNILGCPRLATLDCYENRINGDAMTKLVNGLPDRKNMTSGAFRVVEGYKENGTIW